MIWEILEVLLGLALFIVVLWVESKYFRPRKTAIKRRRIRNATH